VSLKEAFAFEFKTSNEIDPAPKLMVFGIAE